MTVDDILRLARGMREMGATSFSVRDGGVSAKFAETVEEHATPADSDDEAQEDWRSVLFHSAGKL